jgi:hypothetical protein
MGVKQMFKEFQLGNYVLRFYKVDHGWVCTLDEDVLDDCIAQTKHEVTPLSDSEISELWEWASKEIYKTDALDTEILFARAIEAKVRGKK